MHSGLHSYLTLSCAFRFTLVLDTQQCIQVYTRTWHSAVQSGLHSYLTLSCAFRFTLVRDTQQCIQVYTRTGHSTVHSGLHSYFALGNAFRSIFVFDTQLCSQVYTRIWHSAVQSTAVDQTANDPSNGVFVQHLQILAFIVYLLMVHVNRFKFNSLLIILNVNLRSDLTRDLTLSALSSVFEVESLPARGSFSTCSRLSKKDLFELNTCALDRKCSHKPFVTVHMIWLILCCTLFVVCGK